MSLPAPVPRPAAPEATTDLPAPAPAQPPGVERRRPQARAFGRFKDTARGYLNTAESARLLALEATTKLDEHRSGPILNVASEFLTALRLLAAFGSGRYRDISWENMVLIVAAARFLVAPDDLVPDLLPVGYSDEAVVIAFVLGLVGDEVAQFAVWEQQQA